MTDMEINAALAELQTKLPRIAKDQTAHVKSERAQFSYSYADLSVISRAVLPLLGELGLSWTCLPTMRDGKFILAYELRHKSGEKISGEYPLSERGSPQEIGGAITYARRYCLCAVTGVAPDDDDTDAAAAEKAARRRRSQPEQAKPAAAAGVEPMTSGQQREIQRLFAALGMSPDARRERLQFAMDAVGRTLKSATEMSSEEAGLVIRMAEKKLADMPPADEGAGPSIDRQRKHIFVLAGELDLDRDARLAYCSQVTGRDITTTGDLTYSEAQKVIDTMTAFKQQQGG